MRKMALSALLAVGLALAGCAGDDGAGPTAPDSSAFPPAPAGEGTTEFSRTAAATGDIVDTAEGAGFSTLVAAVRAAGLEDALRGDGPLTVFAPTDDAFAALPDGLLDRLLLPENQDKLRQILLYHVLDGEVRSGDLRFYQQVETLEGSSVDILRFFRLIKVDDARVRLADVPATNGVIHVIDQVLVPEGFTLEDETEPALDIVDTAVDAGLQTLVAAVRAAGLEQALRGEGPLTVFAPTEEAFAALPPTLLDALLQPENRDLLQELLLYHVVDSEIRSTNLRRWQLVRMLDGKYTLVRKLDDGRVYVNRAGVLQADVLATNGVVHVIDRVLIPYWFYGRVAGLPDEAPADHPGRQLADPVPAGR